MMRRIQLLCLLSMFLLMIPAAQADDTAFGGTGASPMPIQQTGVKMVSEHIVIQGVGLDRSSFDGAWKVSCLFVFKNMTNRTLQFRMGFPFPVKEEFGATSIPKGQKVNVGGPLIYNFSVSVDGKQVPAKWHKIAPNEKHGLYYKNAYIWNVVFKPNQTIEVRHQYLMGVTSNAMGQTLASYILKTGGMWYGGRIGRAQIEVIPNVPTRLCREIKSQAMHAIPPSLPGEKIVGSKSSRKYVWDLYDFKPTQDIDLCFQTGEGYIRYNFIYPLVSDSSKLNNLTAGQLRILKNVVFAQHGRLFKDGKLQAYFDRQWWYLRNPNYSDALLTNYDHKVIKIILQKMGSLN